MGTKYHSHLHIDFLLFIKYLKLRLSQGSLCVSLKREGLEGVKDAVGSIRRICKRKADAEQMDKMKNKMPENTLNPDDIQKVMDSSRIKEAYDMLIGKKPVNVNSETHAQVRSYMFGQLLLANAQRTGALANMTLSEIHEGKQKGSSYIINVKSHKSYNTYGSAELVVKTSTMGLIFKYIQSFRPKNTTSPYVFINYTGNQMSSGTLINSLAQDMASASIEKW
jgi:hypothetical protein